MYVLCTKVHTILFGVPSFFSLILFSAPYFVRLHIYRTLKKVLYVESGNKYCFQIKSNLCLHALNEMLTLYVNERELRSNDEPNAVVPKCRTQWVEQNFAYRAVVYWNSLPLNLKCPLPLIALRIKSNFILDSMSELK